jgi:hypothetical protein
MLVLAFALSPNLDQHFLFAHDSLVLRKINQKHRFGWQFFNWIIPRFKISYLFWEHSYLFCGQISTLNRKLVAEGACCVTRPTCGHVCKTCAVFNFHTLPHASAYAPLPYQYMHPCAPVHAHWRTATSNQHTSPDSSIGAITANAH